MAAMGSFWKLNDDDDDDGPSAMSPAKTCTVFVPVTIETMAW